MKDLEYGCVEGKGYMKVKEAIESLQQQGDVDWAEVDAAYREVTAKFNDRPKGSFTTNEYASRYGISTSQAGKRIRLLLAAGRATKHSGGTQTYYMLVKK